MHGLMEAAEMSVVVAEGVDLRLRVAQLVQRLLTQGRDVIEASEAVRGFTALHAAVSGNRPGVVELLCAVPGAAAALALTNMHGRTPLKVAVLFGRTACEAVLRAHGATQ